MADSSPGTTGTRGGRRPSSSSPLVTPRDGRRAHPGAHRIAAAVGEAEGRDEGAAVLHCGEEGGIDVVDHELGPAEHGERAVVVDRAPAEVQEALALPALGVRAADVA